MPRIVFRCDASTRIGGGHVSRCMALAQALLARGAQVDLVSRGLPQRVRELLVESTGVTVHDLSEPDGAVAALRDEGDPVSHADWLSITQKTDAAQTIPILRALAPVEWVVVDHYALDARWEREIAQHAGNILAFDDLGDRDHCCDALLDQNFFLDPESRYAGRAPPHAELMLGPRYAPMRAEFAEARKHVQEHTGALRRIFVCFGGFDGAKQTVRALDAVEAATLEGVAVDIVIGSDHPHRREIAERCAARDGYRLHIDAANIAALMLPADLAIGASGIMNWERAALGVPAVITTVAENQEPVACDLAADRAAIWLGDAHEWRAETLAALLRALRGTPTLLRALAARTASLTDGDGARRVASRLLPQPLALRRATRDDCDAMHAWRNTEVSRRYSGDPAPIPLEQHRRWFARVIDDADVAVLIGEREGEPIGVVRYDVAGHNATVSVYFTPGVHGQGLGTALIRAGTQWLRTHRPGVTHLEARIGRDNAASLDAFANAGYRAGSHVFTRDLRHG